MANSGLKGPQIGIKFRFHREVLLQQSRCQKVSQNGNCFPFFFSLICVLIPHITVWGSCFSLGSRRSPPSAAAAPHSSLLITHSLITHSLPPSLARSLTHSLTHYSLLTTHNPLPTTHYSLLTTHYSLLTSPHSPHSLTHSLRQAQYRELAFCVADALHRASWRNCGARGRRCLSGRRSTQSLWTSCAVHRASWTSCGARGRRWGRGCLWLGRRSTQSLLDELRRAWPPLGPRLPLAWQAQYTEPPGRAAARVAAAGAAAAFCVAGAVHRAS